MTSLAPWATEETCQFLHVNSVNGDHADVRWIKKKAGGGYYLGLYCRGCGTWIARLPHNQRNIEKAGPKPNNEPTRQYVTFHVDFQMMMYGYDSALTRDVLHSDLDDALKKMLHMVDAVRVTRYVIKGHDHEVLR